MKTELSGIKMFTRAYYTSELMRRTGSLAASTGSNPLSCLTRSPSRRCNTRKTLSRRLERRDVLSWLWRPDCRNRRRNALSQYWKENIGGSTIMEQAGRERIINLLAEADQSAWGERKSRIRDRPWRGKQSSIKPESSDSIIFEVDFIFQVNNINAFPVSVLKCVSVCC